MANTKTATLLQAGWAIRPIIVTRTWATDHRGDMPNINKEIISMPYRAWPIKQREGDHDITFNIAHDEHPLYSVALAISGFDQVSTLSWIQGLQNNRNVRTAMVLYAEKHTAIIGIQEYFDDLAFLAQAIDPTGR